jgi:hypothetical protein
MWKVLFAYKVCMYYWCCKNLIADILTNDFTRSVLRVILDR